MRRPAGAGGRETPTTPQVGSYFATRVVPERPVPGEPPRRDAAWARIFIVVPGFAN